jgi:hypothetical protein
MRHERSLRDEHDGGRLGKRGSWHSRTYVVEKLLTSKARERSPMRDGGITSRSRS